MSLVLELTVKQQALLYITVQEQSNAQSLPSPDLKSSLFVCVFVWVCTPVHASLCECGFLWECSFHHVAEYVRRECLQGCQRRFKIFSLLSAPTHFSLCTAAQICKSSLLRMQSARSASIYSILHSPLDVLALPPFLSVLSALPLSSSFCCLLSVFGFLFGLSCCVHGICPQWGIIPRWEDFFWAAWSLSLVQRKRIILSISLKYRRRKIAWVFAFYFYILLPLCVLVL